MSTGRTQPPVAPGDVLELREEDYRYGRGPLILRVVAVLGVQQLPDGPWVQVRGIELRPDGSEVDGRDVLVRAVVLPARRRPRGRP